MLKIQSARIFIFAFFILELASTNLEAKRLSFGFPKIYTKKAPYSGLGKVSKANGLTKYKITNGHSKRTGKGYTFVNAYARSR